MDKNYNIAEQVLEAVGGKENVKFVTHCMTRLRFSLKDTSVLNDDQVKAVSGVLGVARNGEQYQVIIGQNVPKVYAHVCEIGGFKKEEAIDENLDGNEKKPFSIKAIPGNIMNYLSGTMTQLIPAMIGAAMFKTVMVVLGPDMLKLIAADSDMYILCDFMYDAFYYFLPVFLGYAGAKKLNASPLLGMMMGTMLIVPDFVAMVGARTTFSIYGLLNVPVAAYGQTILPVILAVWLMSYVEKGLKKVIPDILSTVFVPFLTLLIMVPINFAVCAPAGSFLGNIIGKLLIGFGGATGFIGVAVVAALWEYLVMTGMHGVFIMFAITSMMSVGYDKFILVAGGCATFAAYGMALGALLKVKNKEGKGLALGYFVSGILGGVSEPVLFGIGFKYKKPFIALSIGGALGGLYCGLMGVTVHMLGATNILSLLGHVAGGTANLVHAIIGQAIAFFGTAALTYFIGGIDD